MKNNGDIILKLEYFKILDFLKDKEQLKVLKALTDFLRNKKTKIKLKGNSLNCFYTILQLINKEQSETSEKYRKNVSKRWSKKESEVEKLDETVPSSEESETITKSIEESNDETSLFLDDTTVSNDNTTVFLDDTTVSEKNTTASKNSQSPIFKATMNSTDSREDLSTEISTICIPDDEIPFEEQLVESGTEHNILNNINNISSNTNNIINKDLKTDRFRQTTKQDNIYYNSAGARISLFNNYKLINAVERVPEKTAEERQPYINLWEGFSSCPRNDKEKNALYEVIDTLIEACEQARTSDLLYFKGQTYDFEDFIQICIKMTYVNVARVCHFLIDNESISNRPVYILSCFVNKLTEKPIEMLTASQLEYYKLKNWTFKHELTSFYQKQMFHNANLSKSVSS